MANHFAALRDIPPSNVVMIDWTGGLETATVDEFRQQILQPALTEMARRGIGGQIDYIVYSADFPWAIDMSGDGKPSGLPKGGEGAFTPTASINSLTFLWQFALAKTPNIVAPRLNHYFRHPNGSDLPTRGFSAWRGWDVSGQPQANGGVHYYLSTMLAVTSGRGNTLPEVIDYLKRSASADGKRPSGTVYYAKSADKRRSGPRHDLFPAAVLKLKSLGVRAEVVSGNTPDQKRDVQGAMLGVSRFDWKKTASTLLPGAIGDNLTSFGGVMKKSGGSQTPLSEFLRYGAAGASGTVVEPYNIADKFPHPNLHAHYAAGCTLAEAFYQSIAWPYQVLIVGDPLCRPWAKIPTVTVSGVKPNERVRGTITVKPTAAVISGRGIARLELFVDGVRRDKCLPGGEFTVDTTTLSDGYHELRVVAVEGGAIESQGRAIVPIEVSNRGKSVKLTAGAQKRIRRGSKVELTLDAPGAKRIEVKLHGRAVGTVNAAFGKISIAAEDLGHGPVTLHANAFAGEGEKEQIIAAARPIELEITDARGR